MNAADGAAPEVDDGPHVVCEVEATVRRSLADFDRWFSDVKLETILEGRGAIPRVVGSELVSGVWGDPGARRRVRMADGTQVLEEILLNARPDHFAYVVWDFPGPVGACARYARGDFRMMATDGETTHVRWRYAFRPRNPLAALLLRPVVAWRFRPFMQAGIAAIRREAEAASL